MQNATEVYPNSPLNEVVFELRFPGDMALECQRHEFWQRVKADYPSIWLPKNDPGSHMALQPYRFEREDRSAGILIALNRFGYFARRYPGHVEFQKEFLRVREAFGQVFAIDRLTRIGWRYINLIPFVRQDGLIPLEQFLNLGFRVPPQVPQRFKALSLVFVSQLEHGTVTTRLETVERTDGGQEAMLLDFDYAKEHDLRFASVESYMKEAHEYTRGLFEDLITDEYRQYLRGEVVS